MRKIKPIYIIFFVIVVVVCGIFVFLKKTTRQLPAVNSPSATKTITISEVSKHATQTDCWMAISENVYDVTSYIPNHPGGDQITLGCGKDATTMFNNRPGDGSSHSNRAKNLLTNLQIGVLTQ